MTNDFDAEVQKIIDQMPPPKPEDFISSYDAGSWAAISALMRALRRKGILTNNDLAAMVEDIEVAEKLHRDAGETQLADGVRTARSYVIDSLSKVDPS